MDFKRIFAVSIACLVVFGLAMPAGAQTTTSATTTVVSQIQTLLSQIKALQDKLAGLQSQTSAIQTELTQKILLTRQLSLGMSGEEVKTLQEILAADPSVYPEKLVTGYFGALTKKAVKNFQKKYGIEQLGTVGPKTRAAMHNYVATLSSTTGSLPPGLAKKLAAASSTGLSLNADGTVTVCHYPGGNIAKGETLTIGAPAWQAHQKHGDKLGACGTNYTPSTSTTTASTTVDSVAPVITNVAASTTASTSAVVSWTTSENANAKVWFGTTTPVTVASSTKAEDVNFVSLHSLTLSNLAAGTTYYYFVASSDPTGNTATSSQQSFLTPLAP